MAAGRKSKYTEEVVSKIIESISQGSTFEQAAEYAGISGFTFFAWKAEKPDFSEAIKKAEEARDQYGRELAVSTMFQAMKDGTWQAGAWWLERTNPAKYAKQERVDHTSKDEKITGFEIRIVRPDESTL